ncbi:hypothetical protein JCM6882_005533 [Rhodosporidiobolus microsporus]
MAPCGDCVLYLDFQEQSHRLYVPRNSFPPWEDLKKLLGVNPLHPRKVLYLTYAYVGASVCINSRDHSTYPLQAAVDQRTSETGRNMLHCHATLAMPPGVVELYSGPSVSVKKADEAEDNVDIKVGIHPSYHILSFPSSSPPSLLDVVSRAQDVVQASEGAAFELHLVEPGGALVKLATEEEWGRAGWARAKATFSTARARGTWEAETFQLVVQTLPSYDAAAATPAEGVDSEAV